MLLSVLWGCGEASKTQKFPYHSSSTEAIYRYRTGWQQIMDEGFYGKAEKSYQKAIIHDPEFLMAKSVYARLTLDNDERLQLYKEVEAKKRNLVGDERMLLDVYQSLVNYTNLREQKHPNAKDSLQKALRLAEENFGNIIQKYPDEIHIKAEFVEIIHSLYGDRAALDSMVKITTPKQRLNPFLMGYAAELEANLGNYETAFRKADSLATFFKDLRVPKPHVVQASLHFKKNNLEKAAMEVDIAYKMDPRNLDASRLRARIYEALEKKQDSIRVLKSY
jgi:Tfp pilus assembly protein PilF